MRQIIRTFTNTTFLLKPIHFRFATQTKNVFVLPKRHLVHPTSINQTSSLIEQSYTTKMLAYLFRDNIKYFLDTHVASLFKHISDHNIQVDDTMYSVIIPITIEYINVFTIQNALSLGHIATSAARLNLQSQKLWEAIFAKLDTQNIYKYLNHTQVAQLLAAIVNQGTYINHPLVSKLSGVVAQQKAYYQHFPHLMSLIRATNLALQAKSPQTLKIAENLKQVTA